MKKIDKLTVYYRDRKVGVLMLTTDNKLCTFQYDAEWIAKGFSISPLELPLKKGVFLAKPQPFFGNFGVFEDSLPDGYGRYLLHKILLQSGVNDFDLTALDRLSMVGNSGMGALRYEPETMMGESADTADFDMLQQKALEVLSEKNTEDASLLYINSQNSGGCRPKAIFEDSEGHWLVKFRHTYDPADMGVMEYRYNEVARQCGINVPDFKLVKGKYFASKRFDIKNGMRQHVLTVGGLLCLSLANPTLDYDNLLSLTGYLTQSEADVKEMYRRMAFNYFTGNKDDHCKNFSFICENGKWSLAPAYDLTFCAEGYNGEHATSVNFKGHPSWDDMLFVGKKIRLKEQDCERLLRDVYENSKSIHVDEWR